LFLKIVVVSLDVLKTKTFISPNKKTGKAGLYLVEGSPDFVGIEPTTSNKFFKKEKPDEPVFT
jgi:hypothetical protein